MSQEYIEDKEIAIMPMSSKKRLLEALLILMVAFSCYLMICLLSFDSSDPGWTQTAWHEPIHNYGGRAGAWLADTLLFIFGIMAYAIPLVIVGLCCHAWRFRQTATEMDYFATGIRLIGAISLVITTCGLAAINADDIWNFASGGIIGSLVSTALAPLFSTSASIMTLLCIWAVGFTLYTGWSWLTIAEKIGAVIIALLARITHYRPDKHHRPADATTADEQASSHIPNNTSNTETFQYSVQDQPSSISYDNILTSHMMPSSESSSSVSDATTLSEMSVDPGQSQRYTANNGSTNGQALQTDSLAYPSALTASGLATPAIDQPVRALGDSGNLMGNPVTATQNADSAQHFQPETAEGCTDDPHVISANAAAGTDVPAVSSTPKSAFALAASMGKLSATGIYAGNMSSIDNNGQPSADMTTGAINSNPQVKQGIGPELPRPNPVRIPTRRELAAFGIKLPSERQAEQAQKALSEAMDQQSMTPVAATSQAEAESRVQQPVDRQSTTAAYIDKQIQNQNAYPQSTETASFTQHHDVQGNCSENEYSDSSDTDEESRQQQELARQFALQQQQRYAADTDYQAAESVEEADYQRNVRLDEDSAAQALSSQSDIALPTQPPLAATTEIAPKQQTETQSDIHASLFHPFLVRHEQPLEKPSTPLPVLELLTQPPAESAPVDMFALEQTGKLVEARLNDFRVKAEVVAISPGPVITRFELDLAPGVKAARISNLSRDLARSLSAVAVRVVEVIPGKPYVGLELPNQHRQTVYLREVLDCPEFRDNPSPLSVVLGKDISGAPVVADLAKMPHLLVAGTTGSGKSVGVNAMILSMLYKATPDEVRFIMIDPKMLELSVYEGIPHLLTEVVTDMKDAANALRWSVTEMERRYKLMSALGVRNLAGYNDRIAEAEAMGRPIPDPFWKPGDSMDTTPPVLEKLPYIVVMVDEFADLMMAVGKKVEELIARLAQKARAAGIHLVLATQRPSVDVITGLIKANIPTRIAFTVSSKIDSRTIIDQSGAESLLGMGDMLYMPPNSSMPVRVHGAFVRDQEVHAVVQDWKARGRPQYIQSITAGDDNDSGSGSADSNGEDLDPLFDQAVVFVVEKRRASISGVQRQFRIGYNRAARIIEQMEAQGIVSEPGHNGNREVLSPPPHEL